MQYAVNVCINHLTSHYSVADSSCSYSIHSKHCNVVGSSWYTRHCVATQERAQLCLSYYTVVTGIIGHNIVKDWKTIYQWWGLKLQANLITIIKL